MTATRYLLLPVAAVALLAVVLAAAAGTHDDCGLAQQAFSECVAYAVGVDPVVTPACCTGLADIRDLAAAAPAGRRELCACLLSEVTAAGRIVPLRAANLAAACNVRVGFVPTAPGFDCSKIP